MGRMSSPFGDKMEDKVVKIEGFLRVLQSWTSF